jgi:hypothetical protein
MVSSNHQGHGLENSLRRYWSLVLQRCQTDHSVFHLHTSAGYILLLVVYVDDIVITGDDSGGIAQLKQFLQQRFHTKDLGKL